MARSTCACCAARSRGSLTSLSSSGKRACCRKGTTSSVLSSGIMTEEAMRAVRVLKQRGLGIRHMHISTLKPFNDRSVMEAIAASRFGVITMENHTVIGGLGSIVAEQMAEAGIAKKLVRIGLQDTFSHGASKQYLLKEHGMDAMSLVREAEKMTGQTFNISEDDLAKAHIAAVQAWQRRKRCKSVRSREFGVRSKKSNLRTKTKSLSEAKASYASPSLPRNWPSCTRARTGTGVPAEGHEGTAQELQPLPVQGMAFTRNRRRWTGRPRSWSPSVRRSAPCDHCLEAHMKRAMDEGASLTK